MFLRWSIRSLIALTLGLLLWPAAAGAQVPGDCNGNGIPDPNDIASGTSTDCDGNGVPDECDIAALDYLLDDGSSEALVGASGGGGFIWFNQFTVVGGNEEIVRVDLAWGRVPVGMETTIAIWTDPDDDGDPNDAVLVQTVGPVLVNAPDTGQFTAIDIPPTFVGYDGEVFFVGAMVHHSATQKPAPLDFEGTAPAQAWFAVGDNLTDLSANATPPAQIQAFGYPGDWLIRCATAARDCNANDVFDTCDITNGTSNDFDGDAVPDECQPEFHATLTLTTDATCYQTGDIVTVHINLADAGQEIVGGQFFFQYDPTRLTLVSADPADPNAVDPNDPFEVEIFEHDDASLGTLDYAVSAPAGAAGTTGSVAMATLKFMAQSEYCDSAGLVAFRANDPPTRLSGQSGAEVFVSTTDLPAITIDGVPPVLSPPSDQTRFTDPGQCTVTFDPGTATASDNCTPTEQLDLSWQRSDGAASLTEPYDAADSPIVITWHAGDACGAEATATTTITVRLWADLDGDADVDLADLAIMLANYGAGAGMTYDEGDLDGDGDVDLADLAELLANYGLSCG